jgi:type I restriction enzyme M protein
MTEIAKALWKPAKDLYRKGVSYDDYLTELTWLWLLKVAPTYGVTTSSFNWDVLISQTGQQQYNYYKKALAALEQVRDPFIAGIFRHAHTSLKQPKQLAQIIATLTILDDVSRDELGEIYEELLAQCARETGSLLVIAPRPLVELMVILTQPRSDELILDPLAGVGSFLIAADKADKKAGVQEFSGSAVQQFSSSGTEIIEANNNGAGTDAEAEGIEEKQLLIGMESNLTRQRLALMNCLLHQLDYLPAVPVQWRDSLLIGKEGLLPPADVILSMLVFAQQEARPEDCLQYIYRNLKPGGRAAVIVPDSVCTAPGVAQGIRRNLLDTCVVHTVLRLPIGIFYPHQIAAHVLFFKRSETALEKTKQIWFYDARSSYPTFGQTLQLSRENLMDFEMAYGADPLGLAPRHHLDKGKDAGRWRCINWETLVQRGDRLALNLLEGVSEDCLPPGELRGFLNITVQELERIGALLV